MKLEYDMDFRSRRSNVLARNGMVATSQPLAAQAGLEILRQGGNAADAAVATAAMLNVVEPTSTGIGGDCFALYWDASSKKVTALNGSGRSAAASSIDELKEKGYDQMPRFSGQSVSVPGTVAGWCDLIDRHGSMSIADLMQPAIRTAEEGYPVTEWIARGWATQAAKLRRDPDWSSGDRWNGPEQPSGHELLIEGRAPRAGEVMKIPTLGETLRRIAAEGKRAIYAGEVAERLSEHVQRYGGWITTTDLQEHQSTWDEPITARFGDVTLYECPPNGQGLAATIAVNIAAGFDLAAMSEAERIHTLIEAMRLGYADAQLWVADAYVVDLPLEELCSAAYAEKRRALIQPGRANPEVASGRPLAGSDTVYLTTADGHGNACSFINSLYQGTGTGLVVPGTGVSLQNRAALFRLDPDHPNGLAPAKRPYHTIIPAMTTRDDELHASFGVMGGYMQPQGHLQMVINMVTLGHSPQKALDVPRWQLMGIEGGLGAQEAGGLVGMEPGWSDDVLRCLSRWGHHLRLADEEERGAFGGGQIIVRNPESGVLIAGSDPRKDGCAVGW